MASLVQGLIICLLVVQTIQRNGTKIRTKIRTKSSATVRPKTFMGGTINQNHSKELQGRLDGSTYPWLRVSSEDTVRAYTTGLLSTSVIPSAYIILMLVGIPSNAYILTSLRLRAKSFTTAVLYLNLALSDLLLLISLALRVHYHFNGNDWTFGETSCRLVTALFYGNVYCSAQTIACISVHRYLAVVRPFLYRRLAKTTLVVWMCLVVWFLFGAAIVPELLVRQTYQLDKLGITTCHDVLPLQEKSHFPLVPYRLMLVCVGVIVPFLICIYAHAAVVYHLSQSGCDWRPFIRVSSVVFIIFVLCFLPSGVLHIAHYTRLLFYGDDGLYGYYRVAVSLCCFHSCLDPFLCMLVSKTATSDLQFVSLHGPPKRSAVMM